MNYRDARLLKPEDQVISKKDGEALIVKSIECYGSIKIVKLNVVDQYNNAFALYNEQVK